MGFTITFRIPNPVAAGRPFSFDYDARNDGPDDPGHIDHIQAWGSDGSQPLDVRISALATVTGQTYTTTVDMPALTPGIYDVSVSIPGSLGAGSNIHVQ